MSDTAHVSNGKLESFLPYFDQSIRIVVLLYVAGLPFTAIHAAERIGFLLLLAALVVWCVWHRRHFHLRTPIDVPLGMFVLWVGLTIPFAADPVYSLQEFGKLIKQVLIFYTVLYFFQERKSQVHLIWLMVGVALLISLYGLVHYEHPQFLSMTSVFPSEVWLVTYLLMMLPLCAALALSEDSPWTTAVAVVGVLLGGCCLLLTQSRAGLLAFIAELWGAVLLTQRRAVLMVAGAVTALALILASFMIQVVTLPGGSWKLESAISVPLKLDTTSAEHRRVIWVFMLEQIGKHPIVGIGYGKETVKALVEQIPADDILSNSLSVRNHGAHNILLELALHVGIPGLLLFIWLVVRLGKTVMTAYRQASDGFARAVLLGVGVGMCGLVVRLMFDQMLVGVLAVEFWVLAASAMLAAGSYRLCPDREAAEDAAGHEGSVPHILGRSARRAS